MWRFGRVCTYRRSSEGRVVAVLLPGAVEAQCKILEERMSLVEDGEADDVDPLVRDIIQPQQSEFLRARREENGLSDRADVCAANIPPWRKANYLV